ncbi:MAG: NADH-quinone oxidoreductase subunit H [Deltaproteobacteria bacterium]|nr:NADH-quinone oxidoreductase subunit H [Deltaproteobacteria bacterium]
MIAWAEPVASTLLRAIAWIALAPLVPGIIHRTKAWIAGRRGPPILQLYYDLARLWRKEVVWSSVASPMHLLGPAVAWVAVLGAALLVPTDAAHAGLDLPGSAILFVYLLALARFGTAAAAMDTGSAFEGMGAAREVSYAVLSEVALVTGLLALSVHGGSASLAHMFDASGGVGSALLAGGLFVVLLAENCRVPFDDPNTHLELTMVHEVMVLDHSGPPLAVILHGASLKLAIFSVLLVKAVVPLGQHSPLVAVAVLGAAAAGVGVGVGIAESLMARLAFRRVPLLLTTAFLLNLFALLVEVEGGRLR